MRKIHIVTGTLLALAIAAHGYGACTGSSPTWTSTPDSTSVAACISSATTGDTINISSGSATWSTIVTLNKAITLAGATTCTGKGATLSCTDNTTISGVDSCLTISSSNARVTGITMSCGASGLTGILVNSGFSGWRIDHIHITSNTSARGIYVNGGTGLIDHAYIDTRNGGIDTEGQNAADGPYPGDYNWTQPLGLGTSNAVYVEDSYFNWTSQTDGGYDLYNGARFVFRFNYLNAATIGEHGLDSSAGRSTMMEELYNNTSAAQSFDHFTFWNTRGGTQMIFNNTTTTWGLFADVRVYRTNNGYGWGNGNTCVSNSNYIDQNTGHGYACRDQVGRSTESDPANDWPTKTTTSVFSEILAPTYMWSNTLGGSAPTYATDGSGTISVSNAANDAMPNDTSTYEVLLNRDFYIQGASFTGATGVGVGVRASRPATCTKGVAYWSTDQGSWNLSGSGGQGVLDLCTATNTWTNAYYTPYTYPYPTGTPTYTLSTATAGTGSGTVTGCAGSYAAGAGYSCTVSPAGGSTLTSVTGCGGSGTTTYTGTMPGSNCTVTATFQGTASAPTFAPIAGTYTGPQSVTLSTSSSGCSGSIYSSTIHNPPTNSDTNGTSVNVAASETVYAKVIGCSGYTDSAVGSALYTINLPATATPTFSPVAGPYGFTQTVTISDATGGATIYYTTDGSTPTTGSTVYTTPLTVSTTQTVKALAAAAGHVNSAVGSATYTINIAPSPPTNLTGHVVITNATIP